MERDSRMQIFHWVGEWNIWRLRGHICFTTSRAKNLKNNHEIAISKGEPKMWSMSSSAMNVLVVRTILYCADTAPDFFWVPHLSTRVACVKNPSPLRWICILTHTHTRNTSEAKERYHSTVNTYVVYLRKSVPHTSGRRTCSCKYDG